MYFNDIDNILEIRLPRYPISRSKYLGGDEDGFYFKIPRSAIAGIFALMLAYVIIRFSLYTISDYNQYLGPLFYLILGVIILLGAMIFLSLLAVRTTADFANLMSLVTGGIVLIALSKLELLAIPVALGASLVVYILGRIGIIGIGMVVER